MHLIDHEDYIAGAADLLHDFFEALLKFTPVFGACHQQADVQGEDSFVFEDVWNITRIDSLSQAFGDGCFAYTRLAN